MGISFYQSEIEKIRKICYSNKYQIQTVIDLKKFIDRNFDSELKLDFIAHAHFTSKFHLLRLFQKYYGMTPKQYCTDRRIEKSKEYLAKGISVAVTCYSVGFQSASSFSTLFRRKTGLAPAAYQKKQFSQRVFATD